MKKSDKLKLGAAIAAVVAVSAMTTSMPAVAADVEKCYGISKKGMNDCGNDMHACAGQSAEDGNGKDWIYVIKGTCEKIVNGESM